METKWSHGSPRLEPTTRGDSQTLQDIGLEDGLREIKGFHYSLNGGSECIVTMPDDFDGFRTRVDHLGKGVRIVIRLVDPQVNDSQYSSC